MTKHLRRWLLLATITTLILCCSSCGVAYAESIEEYEQKIQENNYKIEQLENIKTQLHITAELLRETNHINLNLDDTLSAKWVECANRQADIRNEISALQNKINEVRLRQNKTKTFVGLFAISYYCPNACCGSGTGLTKLGTQARPQKTIAVDPSVIPLGSEIEINGAMYVAEDTGSAIKGNKIDICVATHDEAVKLGISVNTPVYVYR